MKEKIDLVLTDIKKLPAMSSIVAKVLQLVNDPNVNIQTLATEISKDTSITANVIKLSNSAYYRPSKPIRTVPEALMTLGTKTVKEIVLITAAKGILEKDLQGYQIESDNLWLHSLMVAELASRISSHRKLPLPKDLVFTSGMLVDIGKLVLAQFFQPVLFQLREELKTSNAPFYELEKKYFGYTHMEISGKLLTIWNFPNELIDVVTNYNTPELSKTNPLLSSVVHIANTILVVSGIGIDIGGISTPLSPFALEKTGLSEADIQSFFVQIPEIETSIQDLRKI